MKRTILMAALTVGLALISGCASEAVSNAAIYGAANAVAYPPSDANSAVNKVASKVQSDVKEAVDHVNNLGGAAKEGVYHGMDSVADWMRPAPPPKPPQAIAASYCYHTYQDILCYRQPMPGWEFRLVGYQGTYAKAPPAAIMEPLPVQAEAKPVADRTASAQPVFTTTPKSTKDDKKSDSATATDSTHETLPNAMAPQL